MAAAAAAAHSRIHCLAFSIAGCMSSLRLCLRFTPMTMMMMMMVVTFVQDSRSTMLRGRNASRWMATTSIGWSSREESERESECRRCAQQQECQQTVVTTIPATSASL